MSGPSAISGARRAARIRRIVEEVMARRSRGEGATDSEVIAANPELMPDLARELSLLTMLERAKHSAMGLPHFRSRAGRGFDGPIEPLGEDAFAGFRVVKEIRRGGQGVVYEAVQGSTGRRVAIKMMREGLFSGDRDAARFEREVRILGQLEHPGVVGILASGIRGGHFYYAMEFVEGVPLDQYAESIGRRTRDVMAVMEKVADAVSAAHLRGIIHRDLKPGNVLVDGAGVPRILDFGLARIVSENDVRMTATGQFVGSMPWASPEQAGGDPSKIDLRTDVYSLGVMLYQALTGKFPYEVDTGPREAMENIAHAAPARLRSVSVDAGAEAITLKCLSKDPERRYQSAGELAADIRRYLAGGSVLAHAPSFWYAARTLARRHRALVGGAAAVVVALVLGLIGTTAGLLQASAAQRSAVRERDEAKKHAYAATIAAADSALRVHDAGAAKAHLRASPEAYRGWEWRYLAARTDQSRETLALPRVWDAKVTVDGHSLLVLSREPALSLTDLSGGNARWTSPVTARVRRDDDHQFIIGLSRDGGRAVTQHGDFALVWNLADGTLIHTLEHEGSWGYMSASFSADGSRLLTSGRDGILKLWHMPTGALLNSRGLFVAGSPGADFSPDGAHIAASWPEGIVILDADTLEIVRELRAPGIPHPEWGWVRYSTDGAWVIGNFGTYIGVMDPAGLRPTIELRGGDHVLLPFSLSKDGTKLAAGSWDRTVRVWNLSTGALERTLIGHEQRILSTSFADQTIISAGADGAVKAWDLDGATNITRHQRSFRFNVLPPGDEALFYGLGSFGIVDLETGGVRELPEPAVGGVWAVAPSPDGRTLVTAIGARVSAWNLEDGSNLWHSESSSDEAWYGRFFPDGSRIATLHKGDVLEFRDAKTGAVTGRVPCIMGDNSQLCFRPDSAQLAVSGFSTSFIVIDVATSKSSVVYYPPEYGPCHVVGVSFNADGTRLVSCDTSGSAVVWDAADWKPLRRLTGMPPTVWSAAFSPDGERLALGSQDRTVHIFETREWTEALVLRGHTGSVSSVAWTRDGRRVLSSGNDGTLRIWDAGPAAWATGGK